MTIFQMLGQSGILTLLGMGIVFSFLIILVVFVTLVGKLLHAVGADKDVRPAVPTSSGGASGTSGAVTAAISAAVTEYGKSRK
ncbi:MAG: OadG family protein [Treponema sp.]|jgi:oxaloacetate decarboxylase gamma subunit|nr:OadG family protein [Treponema sp.]